jgi:predicted DNA-binding transcriptional regulator AlpA
MDERLLKIDDCLKIIPMAKSTFWQRVKEGELPQPVKIKTSTFWKHSDLMAYIANMPQAKPNLTAVHPSR